MKKEDLKFCKDCKHYRMAAFGSTSDLCEHPDFVSYNLVTGSEKHPTCEAARQSGQLCSYEAFRFEPKKINVSVQPGGNVVFTDTHNDYLFTSNVTYRVAACNAIVSCANGGTGQYVISYSSLPSIHANSALLDQQSMSTKTIYREKRQEQLLEDSKKILEKKTTNIQDNDLLKLWKQHTLNVYKTKEDEKKSPSDILKDMLG